MISLPIHDQTGKPTGRTYEFDPAELAPGINKQLLHDAVVMYEANLRQGTFKTKTRSEVAGSKKKLFKQKGTGNARMGTKRSGIRRGGGHIFAKLPTEFRQSMPKKAMRLATRMALLSKFMDGEAVVVDAFVVAQPKTKAVVGLMKNLGIAGQSCLFTVERHDPVMWKSARNIPSVGVSPAADLNAYKLLKVKRLVVTEAALKQLREQTASN
ncbi:MAG: 50S ribosomal protein L4 [Planctomycetaceae bacterium]|nr:50S ribosomal protein L4 [Planctomycetaceae bacterium]